MAMAIALAGAGSPQAMDGMGGVPSALPGPGTSVPHGLAGYGFAIPFLATSCLMIHAAIVWNTQHRELTPQEAATDALTCAFPPFYVLKLFQSPPKPSRPH